jgi:hypothetical protein|tara:strand:- start:62 stop:532 length:471 start_codon:yes stop_codon:yes gene_type:complete
MKRFNIKEWQDNYLNESDDTSAKAEAFKGWLDKNARKMKWSRNGNTLSKKQDFANAPEFDVKSGILTFNVNFIIDHSDYMGNVESQSDQIRTVLAKTKLVFINTPMFNKGEKAYKKIYGKANIEIMSRPHNVDIWKHSGNYSRFAQWEVTVEVSPK